MSDSYWDNVARKADDLRAKGKGLIPPTHFHKCRKCSADYVGDSRQLVCGRCQKTEDDRFDAEVDEAVGDDKSEEGKAETASNTRLGTLEGSGQQEQSTGKLDASGRGGNEGRDTENDTTAKQPIS